jgi:trans-aconitate methyltransferase
METETTMTDQVQGPAYYFPSIEKKYGKPVSYWLDLINSSDLTGHKALVDWLKADYGIGHGHATALVGHALAQRRAEGPGT